MKMDVQLAVRMPKSMKSELEKAAKLDGRKVSNLAFKILSDWLEKRKKNG